MNQSLARYHARSPRYILNTNDNELIRVAGPKQTPWEENTEIKNVSLTGLAFTAPEDLSPQLGEVIKIQFLVPGGKQMACFAIVTRIEPDKTNFVLIGVHFYKLEMAHRIVLAQGLTRKVKANHNDSFPENRFEGISVLARVFLISFVLSIWVWVILSYMQLGLEGYFAFVMKLFN